MILTVTMNPSIDISYPLEEFKLDTVNRVEKVSKTPGGKGLNVTRVLSEIGDPVLATGVIGGTTGQFLLEELKAPIQTAFYPIAEATRNCIAILHQGLQTEILEKGPTLSEQEAQGFLAHYQQLLDRVSVVTFSGSLPAGLASDFYVELIALANQAGKPTILDCSGPALEAVLQSSSKPTMIKPNKEELSQLLKRPIPDAFEELKEILQDPLFDGIDWIVVSLGADGAFAKHGPHFYKVDIPKIEVVNPVGSGDSTVAGLASGLYHQEAAPALLIKANVLGMLNAQEHLTGHVNVDHYQALYEQLVVREI